MPRNLTLDITKLILSFMVVAIHCGFLSDYNLFIYYFVINNVFRISIPLFFIINGYFLYYFFEKKTFKIWLKKSILIYFFLMLLYAYFWIDFYNFKFLEFLLKLFFGYFHLWYLSAMILGSLLLFYLKAFSNYKIIIIAFLLFLTGLTIQYTGRLHFLSDYFIADKLINNLSSYRNFLFTAFPFITLGYLINKTKIITRIKQPTIFFITLLSLLLFSIENSIIHNNLPSLPIVECQISYWVGAPILFIIIMKKSKYTSNQSILSYYPTIIYFIHPLLILTILKFTNPKPTLLTFYTFLFTALTAFILIKIKRVYKQKETKPNFL